jgi:hypothetical protein
MGLDFSIQKSEFTDIGFSYSGFMRFRYHVVQLMGIDTGDNINIFESGAAGKIPKDDPLFEFIFHSDCEGELDEYQCEEMGSRLKALLEGWTPADIFDQLEKEEGLKLADAMIRCGNEEATLIFC